MKNLSKRRHLPKKSLPAPTLLAISVFASLALCLVLTLLSATLLSNLRGPEKLYSLAAYLIPVISAVSAGFFCAVFSKSGYVPKGALTGLFLSLLLIVLSLIIQGKVPLALIFPKAPILGLAGALGGFLRLFIRL